MSTDAESEQRSETLLSPELVLVSPELRDFALRELSDQPGLNGTSRRPEPQRPEAFGEDETKAARQDGLLHAFGWAALRAAALAAASMVAVGGVAAVLTISGGSNPPELARERTALAPGGRAWHSANGNRLIPPLGATPDIGVAAVHEGPSPRQGARARAPTSATAPRGLTGYGRLVWNLDALVRDRFGSRPVCLSLSLRLLSPSACAEPAHERTAYRATFAASNSDFRLSKLKAAPPLRARVVPLKAGAGYISCGRNQWLATDANRVLVCEKRRSTRKR